MQRNRISFNTNRNCTYELNPREIIYKWQSKKNRCSKTSHKLSAFPTAVEVALQVADPKGMPPTAAASVLAGSVYEIETRVDGEEAEPWGAAT